MDPYIHSLIHLRGIVLNWLRMGTTSPFTLLLSSSKILQSATRSYISKRKESLNTVKKYYSVSGAKVTAFC